jgi:hypothetical protein
MTIKNFVLVGVLPGLMLFALVLVVYFLPDTYSQNVVIGNSEPLSVVTVLGIALYIGVAVRRKMGLREHLGYGLAMSACAGIVWALLMFLYIEFMNPKYPHIVSMRAIPPNAQGAETTVLPATVEIMEHPVVQFFWRPIICFLWGALFVGILSTIQALRRRRGALGEANS